MSEPIITAEGLSKEYHLGVIGRKTLSDEVAYRLTRLQKGKIKADEEWRPPVRNNDAINVARRQRQNESFWALKDVSFTVQQGEVCGIVGHNGAGKSTLLKILTRITEPTSGRAVINGRVASLLEVGTGFHPELTGRENVYLNGTILGMRKQEIDKKFDEIVEFSEIGKFIDTPVKRFSSGMYVRLAFAVAAHLDPEILLIDEVLAVGDTAFQQKCLGKMSRVASEGRTVLFVSHNMSAVKSLCHNALFLDKGRVKNWGPVENIVRDYVSSENLHAEVIRDKHDENKPFAITRAAITVDGKVSATLYTADTATIEMTCHVKQTVRDVKIMLELFTGLQECLFSSSQLDTLPDSSNFSPGIQTFSCNLPLKNLRAGRYFLNIFAYTQKHDRLDIVNPSPVFEVIDNVSPLLDVAKNRKGFLVPRLKWQVYEK